ncbi:GH32 C-terminal domain-containing protein [Paenibacillus tarimensis]
MVDTNIRVKGIIAHWAFDEGQGNLTKDEISGGTDTVEYVFKEAAFTLPQDPGWRPGVHGTAMLFDGYSTWLTSSNRVKQPAKALTVEVWVAPRSYESGDEQRLSAIINQHDRERRTGYILGIYRHGAWSLQIGDGGVWHEVWSEDEPLPLNQWSHIAATFDGHTGMMRLYLNGVQVAQKETSSDIRIAPSENPLVIGKNNQGTLLAGAFTLNMFNGLIDEVRLYDRALQQEEIKLAYQQDIDGYGGSVPEITYGDVALDRTPLLADRHRPQYHASPPAHWMNEPHAPIYFNGQYHLFYQHNPQGPYFHQIHWGHWVSEDLVHWRDLPVALRPEKDAVDPDGVWSGSAAYDENGIPALFFTAGDDSAVPNQRVGLARSTFPNDSDNDLVHWVKHPEPLIVQHKGQGLFGDFRDPFVWKEGDKWYLLIGSGTEGSGGTALAYTSDNMIDWQYKGPFHISDYGKYPYLGPVWELPVLLPLGRDKSGEEKHLFLISPIGHGADVEVYYWIGRIDKEAMRFIPDQEEPQLIDVGDFHFTGPSGMIDPKTGRAIIFTIAQGERTPQLDYQSGWAHNAGLPISVHLREDGRLGIRPIEELEKLRGEQLLSVRDQTIEETNESLSGVQGDMLEIRVELEPVNSSQFGIKVRRTPEGEEETLLYFDQEEQMLKVNRMKTTLDRFERSKGIQGGRLEIGDDNLSLHIYLDRSMVEAYANGLKSLTTRVYPSRTDALGLQLWADGEVIVRSMEVWTMNGIY